MLSDVEGQHYTFLSTSPAERGHRRFALTVVAVSILAFVATVPFARMPLSQIPAFLPSYESALAINDLITAILLFGQFSRFRSPALLALACGYLFNALIIIPHALSFPGVFSTFGLLGANDQTTAWLYLFWHAGFPLFVLAYALLARRQTTADTLPRRPGIMVALSVGGIVAMVAGLTVLATAGTRFLPVIIHDNSYAFLVTKGISPAVWVLSPIALLALWRRRTPAMLDLWLMVVMCAWFFDVALSAVIGSSRYDLGWYTGRSYGLLASSLVLAVLLLEMNRLYDSLGHAFADAKARNAELLQSREELARAQRLEAIGQLTGGVAHDFNNLLTVIAGNLDMILRSPTEAVKVERWAQSAMKASARGERLTQQLLTFARRQLTRPEVVNPNRVIAEFESFVHRAAGENVTMLVKLDPLLDPARLDTTQFEAALLNLVMNARDAMTPGGRMTIETQNVVLDAEYAKQNPEVTPGSYVMVAVSDTGCGMSADVLVKVFEPFFTTKEIGKGSGLGLSQVYGFVKSANGSIKIYSEVGMGTTVKLYLPKSGGRPKRANGRADFASIRPARGQETILVVEDDEDVLGVAVAGLTELGYSVHTAMDATQALAILRGEEAIDLLFSDVVMPGGMNGAQLAVEAGRLRPNIKILLTSGYTAAALTHEHGLPENVVVLGKPYRREDLASKLRLVING
jgi:signal transduction histidine kinase/CheY-like chemotaxis protein